MHIALFFTFDYTLKQWFNSGYAHREILLYKRFVKEGHRVTFLTYGDASDLEYLSGLEGIDILPVYHGIDKPANILKRFAISIRTVMKLKKLFQSVDILKTNQMWGGVIAVVVKLVYKKKLIVRCGYEWRRNLLRCENGKARKVKKYLLSYSIGYFTISIGSWSFGTIPRKRTSVSVPSTILFSSSSNSPTPIISSP